MTGEQFREALAKLGLSQTGPHGAEAFFGIGARTARRWIADGPPPSAAILVRLMLHLRLRPATVRRIFDNPKKDITQ